jgi:MFS family permease
MNPLIVFVCLAEILSVSAIMYFPALLTNFQLEWGLSNTEAGWINGVYFAGYALAVPILVSLTDRVDARRIFLLSAGLGTASMLSFGWLAQGTRTAAIFRFMAGISFAGTYMPGLKALSDRITGTGQSRAVTFYTSSITIGSSLSVFLAGWLATRLDWRLAAEIMALGPVLGILFFALAVKPNNPTTSDQTELASVLDFRPTLKNRPAVGYMLGYAVHCWELFGFRSWMVAFLVFSLSLQPAAEFHLNAQNLSTLILLVGVPASILGNEGALRWGRRRFITIVMICAGVVGSVTGFSAGLPFSIVTGLYFVYCIAVMADSGSLTAGLVSAARNEERGRTMAIYSFVGFLMAFLAPLAVGGVLDLSGNGIFGWGLAFAALALVQMSGAVWLRIFRAKKDA